jgi:hypothetical protein
MPGARDHAGSEPRLRAVQRILHPSPLGVVVPQAERPAGIGEPLGAHPDQPHRIAAVDRLEQRARDLADALADRGRLRSVCERLTVVKSEKRILIATVPASQPARRSRAATRSASRSSSERSASRSVTSMSNVSS